MVKLAKVFNDNYSWFEEKILHAVCDESELLTSGFRYLEMSSIMGMMSSADSGAEYVGWLGWLGCLDCGCGWWWGGGAESPPTPPAAGRRSAADGSPPGTCTDPRPTNVHIFRWTFFRNIITLRIAKFRTAQSRLLLGASSLLEAPTRAFTY